MNSSKDINIVVPALSNDHEIGKSSTEDGLSISTELREDVYNNIIYGNIKNEIKSLIKWSKIYKSLSLLFTIIKYICLVSVPILSLSSPQDFIKNAGYGDLLAYLSGVAGSLGLGFERLAKLCENINKSKLDKLNVMLKDLHIHYTENNEREVEAPNNDPFTPKRIVK